MIMIQQVFVIALVVVTANTVDWDSQKREKICDDGSYLIEKDLGESQNWHCQENNIVIETFYTPSGYASCQDPLQASFVCMDEDILYSSAPPSSGKMRLQAPLYGEYKYLPPQRWLRALQYGAVAFLHHPCAPVEQVMALRDLAETCLWKHVITPYKDLTAKYPFALVVWGCVYHMTWVNKTEAAVWIRSHALNTPLSAVSSNGVYNSGLLRNATVMPSDVICPGPTSSPPVKGSGAQEGVATHVAATAALVPSCDPTCPTPLVPLPQGHLFSLQSLLVYTLFAFLLTLLVALLVVVLAYLVHGCKAAKRGHSKYKPASSFFSFGTGSKEKSSRVSIPEVGVPSPMPNEREILLNEDSDEEL